MRDVQPLAICLLALMVVANLSISNDGGREARAYKPYRDLKNHYFTVLPPRGWIARDSSGSHTEVTFQHPGEQGVFVRFTARTAPKEGIEAVFEQDKRSVEAINALGISSTAREGRIHGLRCSEVQIRFPGDGGAAVIHRFMGFGIFFSVNYTAPTKALFERYKDEVNRSLVTLDIIPAG